MNVLKPEVVLAVKTLYESTNTNITELANNLDICKESVRKILSGKTYDGIGFSEKYIQGGRGHYLDKDFVAQVINDYTNGLPIPYILENYDISREKLAYIRNKNNIPERFADRAVTLKSITLSVNGEIRTYPSIESASNSLGIQSDFLHKLKRAETFCEGKNSKKDLYLIHDLTRLVKLERASELMGKILYTGTATEKFEWGKELKTLMYELGYASETDIES